MRIEVVRDMSVQYSTVQYRTVQYSTVITPSSLDAGPRVRYAAAEAAAVQDHLHLTTARRTREGFLQDTLPRRLYKVRFYPPTL